MHKSAWLLLFVPVFAEAADPAWLEYGGDATTVIARTIVTSGGQCPSIVVDGKRAPMTVRAAASSGYQVTVCEAAVPRTAKSIRIGTTELPAHKLDAHTRVAILGDTGCRRQQGYPPQNCSDEKEWPFAAVAASIAAWDPDLILHVGDYYYRAAKSCTNTTCSETTVFDWTRWRKDFFAPAHRLLQKAPWVFVRGNHEACSTAAEGWFRFLDTRTYVPSQTACAASSFTEPYVAKVGAMQFLILDSSAVQQNDTSQTQMFAAQLQQYAGAIEGNAWLMLHHPFWGIGDGQVETQTLWTAWQQAGAATKSISLVLTGHIHLLQMLSFDSAPPQAIIGDGGTTLVSEDPPPTSIGGRTVTSFTQRDKYGFIAATPSTNGWTFDVRDTRGKSTGKCAVTATSIVCD